MVNTRLPDKALALPSYTSFPTFLLKFSKAVFKNLELCKWRIKILTESNKKK